MQPLIHKASVHLTAKTLPASVSAGDPVHLLLQDDGTITVILTIPSRLPFGLGRSREFVAGTLGQQVTDQLRPALQNSAHLRLRVVEIEPAHLSSNGQSQLYISVWGDPRSMISQHPQYRVLSGNQINDPPDQSHDD